MSLRARRNRFIYAAKELSLLMSGLGGIETQVERELGQGYGVGFQNLIRYIMEQLPTSEIIKDALRKNVPVYPEITIREPDAAHGNL